MTRELLTRGGLCKSFYTEIRNGSHQVEVWTVQSSKTFWEQSWAQSSKKSWLWVSAHKYTWKIRPLILLGQRNSKPKKKINCWRKNNQPVSHGPWCQGLWHCSLRSPLIILSNWQPFDGVVHKQYSKCKLIINIRVNIGTGINKNTNTKIKKTSRFPHSIKSHKHHQASDGQISDLGSIIRKENTNLVNSCGKMWGRIRAKHVHRQEEVIPGTPLAPLVTWSQSCSPLEKHHNHPVGQRGVQVAIRAPEQQFGIQKFEEQGRYNG